MPPAVNACRQLTQTKITLIDLLGGPFDSTDGIMLLLPNVGRGDKLVAASSGIGVRTIRRAAFPSQSGGAIGCYEEIRCYEELFVR